MPGQVRKSTASSRQSTVGIPSTPHRSPSPPPPSTGSTRASRSTAKRPPASSQRYPSSSSSESPAPPPVKRTPAPKKAAARPSTSTAKMDSSRSSSASTPSESRDSSPEYCQRQHVKKQTAARESKTPKTPKVSYSIPIKQGKEFCDDECFEAEFERRERLGLPQGSSTPRQGTNGSPALPQIHGISPVRGDLRSNGPRRLFMDEIDKLEKHCYLATNFYDNFFDDDEEEIDRQREEKFRIMQANTESALLGVQVAKLNAKRAAKIAKRREIRIAKGLQKPGEPDPLTSSDSDISEDSTPPRITSIANQRYESDPFDRATSSTGRTHLARNPEQVKLERAEKEKMRLAEKERKRRLIEHKKRVKEEREADRKTREELRKLEIRARKKKAEDDKIFRQQLIDDGKDKRDKELRIRRDAKRLQDSAKRRHHDSLIRRKELRLRGYAQRDAQRINSPFAMRHSERIRREVVPSPHHKPSGRSKSEPRDMGRGRFLEPKQNVLKIAYCSRYLDHLNLALERMQDSILMAAVFEERASRSVAESLTRNWSMYCDPFAEIRMQRYASLNSNHIGGILDPDFSFDLSASDTIDTVSERWKAETQAELKVWDDEGTMQQEPFEEVSLLVEKFGFVSLRDLKIPTCNSYFDLPQKMRYNGVLFLARKYQTVINKWLQETDRRKPRVLHYWEYIMKRNKEIIRKNLNFKEAKSHQYHAFRSMVFFLPLHLGDVIDKEHFPREHLIPLARQLFRLILNDWPLLFQPCPEEELHALYRLELAALRLEARHGPTEQWIQWLKPVDNPSFWETVDEERIPGTLRRDETKEKRQSCQKCIEAPF